MDKYTSKAKKLLKSGFWMAGTGHFDITINELSLILQLIELDDFKSIKELYKKLEKERL